MMSLSAVTIPVIIGTNTEPYQLLRQWALTYHIGSRLAPAAALGTTSLYALAAWQRHTVNRSWKIFALAGVSTMMIVPFTIFFMVPTNDTLFALEKGSQRAAAASLEHAKNIVARWNKLHVVRSCLPLLGALLGLAGTMEWLQW